MFVVYKGNRYMIIDRTGKIKSKVALQNYKNNLPCKVQ